jgi:hypothetical protein
MHSLRLLLIPALAALTCAVLTGCTGGGKPGAAHSATPVASHPQAGSSRAAGRLGTPGNPLLLACGQESFSPPPVPYQPQASDLAIGPLAIINGKRIASANPADYGDHGSYKIPLYLTRGSTATVTIAAEDRGKVVIDNPYSPVGGVVAATYHSCSRTPGFFAQGFAFTNGQIRGCVPLDVRINHETKVRHVTLSIFAGSCAR